MRLIAALMLVAVVACTRRSSVADVPECPQGWAPRWSSDSSLSLCVDPAFHPRPDEGELIHASFARGEPTAADFVLFTVSADSGLADMVAWPPRMPTERECRHPDCFTADSIVTHMDTLRDMVLLTDVGLVTGGFAGLRRKPSFDASATLPNGRRVFATGWATHATTIDTVRLMLRTMRLADALTAR